MRSGLLRLAGLGGLCLATLSACVVVGVESDVRELRYAGSKPAGYVVRKSDFDFGTTLSRLQAAVDERGLTTFAVIDHAGGAASVGVELRPTTLVVFGSPKVGAPIMQASQTAGADLPLRALVYEAANGATYVARPDAADVFARHGVEDLDEVEEKIADTLEAIVDHATDR